MVIVLSNVKDYDGSEYIDVFGYDRVYNRTYALDIMPWKDWLRLHIDSKTIDKFSYTEIAAHCLYEMTFHGYEEQSPEEFSEKLYSALDEL